LTFVVRTQDQPRRTGTVTALHRADIRVTAVLEGEAEFRRRKVERVMGIEPSQINYLQTIVAPRLIHA
jgi:hypothetical protein